MHLIAHPTRNSRHKLRVETDQTVQRRRVAWAATGLSTSKTNRFVAGNQSERHEAVLVHQATSVGKYRARVDDEGRHIDPIKWCIEHNFGEPRLGSGGSSGR